MRANGKSSQDQQKAWRKHAMISDKDKQRRKRQKGDHRKGHKTTATSKQDKEHSTRTGQQSHDRTKTRDKKRYHKTRRRQKKTKERQKETSLRPYHTKPSPGRPKPKTKTKN